MARIPLNSLSITNLGLSRDGVALAATTGNPVPGGSTLRNSPTVITNGRNISSRFQNGVIDVSLIPFMRSISIDFVAYGMRPNRLVWFFFDNIDVTNRIVRTDILELSNSSNTSIFNGGVSNSDFITSGTNANTARVQLSRRKYLSSDLIGSGVVRTRTLNISNVTGEFANTRSITGSVTGNTGTISNYIHRGSHNLGLLGGNTFTSISGNTIILPTSAKNMANNYWGTNGSNNITLIPHGRRGLTLVPEVRANIVGYNNVTRTLTLTQTHSTLFPNEPVPITANQISLSFNTGTNDFYTSDEGMISGTFVVPAGIFRTGDRIFRIIDVSSNIETDCTTRADYTFTASGINQTKNDVIINSRQQTTTSRNPIVSSDRNRDPVAQTFFVDESSYPNGMFIPKVELWFRSKDDTLPVTISIRPTINGYPHSSQTLEFATSTLQSEEITTYNTTPYSTGIIPYVGSIFRFPNPIYLAPGEYALVVKSDSPNYEVWLSELGQKITGTTRTISEQPYVGSYFKSQNASTWTASQLEDLMFRLYKCKFSTSGTVSFQNKKPEANIAADIIYTHAEDILFPNTSVSYTHSYDSGSTYSSYNPDTNFNPVSRINIDNIDNGKYRLTGTLNTNDTNISPILKTDLYMTLAIENIINNANISNADITITNNGAGYTQNANVSIVFANGFSSTGFTAVGYASANVNGSGTGANGLSVIRVTDGGAGYSNTASATVIGGDNTARLLVSSELRPSGGPAIAKYISRTVSLAEGFEAGDLKAYITAYKPQGTDIKVYYKVRNTLDPQNFSDKNYFLMNQKTPDRVKSLNITDPLEYEYKTATTANSTTYTSGTTTYTSFNQFAIKIVMLSDNTVNIPILYDLRILALPSSL